jgi:hypothetical protein
MLLFWILVLRGHFIPLFKQENVELNGCFLDVHVAEPRLRKHLLKLLLFLRWHLDPAAHIGVPGPREKLPVPSPEVQHPASLMR